MVAQYRLRFVLGLLVGSIFLPAAALAEAPPPGAAITPEIFTKKGCIQCHMVSAFDIEGGETGPDLSVAFTEVPTRFGMSLDQYMAAPVGTMKSVLETMITLTDDEKQGIVKLLEEASKKSGAEHQDL